MIGAVFIWRRNLSSIWMTGMVGGLLEIGDLVFADSPGSVHFCPGALMALISASAAALSFWVWLTERSKA